MEARIGKTGNHPGRTTVMMRLRLFIVLLAAAGILLALAPASASASPNIRPRPYQITTCAPHLWPNTTYRACETVNGQGDYIRWVSGQWMAWEANIAWPSGRWHFDGYGQITGTSFSWTYGPLKYSGYRVTRYWWTMGKSYVDRYVKPHSQICSAERDSNGKLAALVCFNAP